MQTGSPYVLASLWGRAVHHFSRIFSYTSTCSKKELPSCTVGLARIAVTVPTDDEATYIASRRRKKPKYTVLLLLFDQ